MKKFVTLFPQTMNYHLTKDVGMIPFVMGKDRSKYDTELVTYNNDNYSYLKNEVKGLQLSFIQRITGKCDIDTLIYIWKNAKDIDILHLFHWGRNTLLRTIVYKFRNPKGVTFVKLDIDSTGYEVLERNSRSEYVFKKILRKVDFLSAESTFMQEKLNYKFGADIKYFPNGFTYFSNDKIIEKEKIILTVGRIGTEQKASKELVEGFMKFWNRHKDWKLVLVGPVEDDFQDWYSNYNNEHKTDSVIEIVGEITDKDTLESYYKSASVFALPSRWESFGLVLVEAMSFGCSLLTTEKVVSAKDILNDNCVMIPTEREEDIANGLVTLVDKIGISERTVKENIEYVQERFSWDVLAKRLDAMLNEID